MQIQNLVAKKFSLIQYVSKKFDLVELANTSDIIYG